MARLWIWLVKSILGVAQFAMLSRLAERSGLRNSWIHPVAGPLAQATRLNEELWVIILLALTAWWLVWVVSALCRCLSATLGQGSHFGNGEPYPR
jgi:hypothetical protein